MIASFSQYKILKTIGEGGMGVVYQALDMNNNEKVAIKELLPQYSRNDNFRKRFLNEAALLNKLRHPNIVRYHNLLQKENSLFMIMEFVEGQTLDEYIKRISGSVPEDLALNFMESILNAFQYAHKHNVVHRDIKPNNIVITLNEQIKVLDFGIAKLSSSYDMKLTNPGTMIGTPVYMSPEQVKGKEIDTRSDIYSLGILLFTMITGNPPYDERTMSEFEIKTCVIKEPLPRVRDQHRNASNFIQQLIDKATQKEVSKRYQSCETFLTDIRNRKVAARSPESRSILKPVTKRKTFPGKRILSIGRDSSCDIVIDSANISRFHAEISIAQSSGGDITQYRFSDKSSNGTMVNGIRIQNADTYITPYDSVLLSEVTPLPWEQVSSMLSCKLSPADKPRIENVILADANERVWAFTIDFVLALMLGLIFPVGTIIALLYIIFRDNLPFFKGQSIGKKIMNIRVVREQDLQPFSIELFKAVKRSFALLILNFSELDKIANNTRKRTGDRWANTIVVKLKNQS